MAFSTKPRTSFTIWNKSMITPSKISKPFIGLILLSSAIVPVTLGSALAQSVVECTDAACDTPKTIAANPQDDLGFSISVDGEVVDGSDTLAAEQRRADVDLNEVDIQVKFDGLDVKPVLNVSTHDLRRGYEAGETVRFNATSNYPAWIASSEIRIFDNAAPNNNKPLAVVPVNRGGQSGWQMPGSGAEEYRYVLRVYDNKGRFDETESLSIFRASADLPKREVDGEIISAGNGEDRTAVRNIPVYGGAVTVYGRNIPEGFKVRAIGEDLPIDGDQQFVVQRILPPGDHRVAINVDDAKGDGLEFNRAIHIPANDWFYVGIADLTVGKRFGGGSLLSADGDYDDVYTKGRLAFYLKGKIKGKYLLTAAADTAEGDLDTLFSNLNRKDPRQLLRRIDPDEYYPVYGDDSTTVEDAPTQGRFYVRLERGDSHVMWGNYKTKITGSKFIRNERGLYGSHGVYKSETVTKHGDRKVEVEAYTAQPDTLPQRDIMRGTGGSAYFLTRQDITKGSERVSIETRDELTGQVTGRRFLQYGRDYTIDYVQGVIILKQPLSSTSSDGDLVRTGSLGDNSLNLVVQYEFTPALEDVEGHSYGGRAQAWIGNNVRIGVSGLKEETGDVDSRIVGADVRLRLGDNSYVEGEIAQSEGAGFGNSFSNNGGLTINNSASGGINGKKALAYSVKGQLDLSDFDPNKKGIISAYYERRNRGFTSLDYNDGIAQRIWGVLGTFEVDEHLKLKLKYEDFAAEDGRNRREGVVDIQRRIDEAWGVSVGVKYTDQANPTRTGDTGERADIAVQLDYTYDEDTSAYIFGQVTAYRDGGIRRNDRAGLGGTTKITEKLGVKGEVSYGTTGLGGLAAVTYDPTVDDHYYFGYRLDPDRATLGSTALYGSDRGAFVFGTKRRHNDDLSSFVENSYDVFGDKRSLNSTYGVIYTPDKHWTYSAGVEFGDVDDRRATDLSRTAISGSIGYKDKDGLSWNAKAEVRVEDSEDDTQDRNSFFLSGGFLHKVNPDWRMLSHVDALISRSDQSDILDGDYVEASFGFAYRPVDNDRFNALLKYTFLYDLPGSDQVSVNGSTFSPAQRSHIFTADASYDLIERLTVGGKYGFRIGDVSATRADVDFQRSSAHLAVLRADFHVIKKWDLLLEGRVLATPSTDTVDYGALAAVYYHAGKNLKVGVGYNFGKFSDDLSDVTHDDGGIFFNVIGKF